MIKQLECCRGVVSRRLAERRAAIAPEKRLPTELLAEIFTLSVPEGPLTLPPKHQDFPWVLRSVCSRWRQVALEMHALWNDVSVTVKKRVSPRFLLFVASILPPNGPVSISLVADCKATSAMAYEFLIAPNLSRLSALSLDIPPHSIIVPWADQLVSLHSLELKADIPWGSPDSLQQAGGYLGDFLANVSSAATNMRHFKLSSFSVHFAPSFFDRLQSQGFPFHQLLSLFLNFEDLSISSIKHMLRLCPQLVSFSAETRYYMDGQGRDVVPRQELPRLTSLSLNCGDGFHDDLLDATLLPWAQLSHVCLKRVTAPQLLVILKQLTRIEDLEVETTGHQWEPQQPDVELLQLPRLLSLNLTTSLDHLLHRLVIPNLTSLIFKSTHLIFPADELSSMILQSGCTLKNVFFSSGGRCHFQTLPQLLAAIPSVITLTMNDIGFHQGDHEAIGRLRFLEVFECRNTDAFGFTEMVQDRMKLEQEYPFSPLRKAWCVVPIKFYHSEPSNRMKGLAQEIEALGQENGRDFKLDVTAQT
ncbi:hypothetical protein DXG01_013384 [Tephrocybe rancida]|nr:hypothetical protein DXG01_013384 [Tephrocybe rancida]